MCQPNVFAISLKRGVLLRVIKHGDRSFIEHDGESVYNTIPADVDITIGTIGLGKKMVDWARRNLKELKYVHDFAGKMVEVKAVDTNANAVHAVYPDDMNFVSFLEYLERNDIDDLTIRASRIINNEEGMKKMLKSLRTEYEKARNEEN